MFHAAVLASLAYFSAKYSSGKGVAANHITAPWCMIFMAALSNSRCGHYIFAL